MAASLPAGWMAFGAASWLGLASPVWLLVLLVLFWLWFRRTRLGLAIRATGSNERSAFLSGVLAAPHQHRRPMRLSGVFAALAALYLDDADRQRLADHRQGLHPAVGRRGGDRRHQPVRRPRRADRHHHRRLSSSPSSATSSSRSPISELLAADRLRRDPARRRAGEFAVREIRAAEPRREPSPPPRRAARAISACCCCWC